ncbi:sialate O-acetylesterase [Luteimonas sp. RD2P54]|uniref:Sialate O-acetylesterase n=1 Tax=Luteimonas endophytica TaxID=3042023 RepID=A0ABT6J6T6_9GAMM|nr:sialate O-acetylesterase [Luteimonas endophytica]MDH5822534.1 sialate O-acetylesterase [Luteimonas endophytica]
MSVFAPPRRTRRAAPPLLAALALALSAAAAASAQQASAGSDAPAPLLHPMFQDHAVLQRGQPLRVYGTAQPGEPVQLEFAGRRASARADADGRWEARLPALPAGGPHALTARAGEREQRIEDVLVGDVWLCAGQSNMELQVWRALDARAELAGAGNDRIRLLTVPKAGAPLPQDGFAEPVRWRPVGADSVRDFSAACYFFARELQRTVDVPMGLVSAAWGGSRIQAWTSAPALRAAGGQDGVLAALAQYAVDPVAAAGRWGELWAEWWAAREGTAAGDEPWRTDPAPGGDWRPAPPALGPWEQWGVPELADYDGMVWYRASARLSAAQAAQDAVLVLGPVDETDMTWVNGRGVGSAYDPGRAREYPLPAGLLQAGDNSVVVNALDTYRAGGLGGPGSAQYLRLADGSRVPLRDWRYRAAPGNDWPPPAPWQSAAGMSTLYNGMIAPLGRYGLRGALWYQGESNTFEADRYGDQLRTLRADWRDRFGEGLPLLVVQLAGYGMPKAQPAESDWAELREAQRRVAAEDAGTGLAVTIDIGDRYDLHPPNKQELGRRLARAARHVVYGERLAPSGPVPSAVRRQGDTVVVSFAGVDGELLAYGAPGPVGFELCGPQPERCRWAQADIRGGDVVLRDAPAAATRVRYGWADSPLVNLFDGAGLPAGPFEARIEE